MSCSLVREEDDSPAAFTETGDRGNYKEHKFMVIDFALSFWKHLVVEDLKIGPPSSNKTYDDKNKLGLYINYQVYMNTC